MKWVTAILVCCSALCAADARLFFSKSFPGSVPDYVAITVTPNGAVEYKEAVDDERPLKLQLSATDADRVLEKRLSG